MAEVPPDRNSSQESIYQALAEFNLSLADLYEGARESLSTDQPIPGWGRFVPHAVREITTRLPDMLAVPKEPPLQYSNRVDDIGSQWRRAGLLVEGLGLSGRDDGGVSIPAKLAESIGRFVGDHERSSRETVRDKLHGVASKRAPSAERGATARWGDHLRSVHRWAQAHVHERLTTGTAPSLPEYRRQFSRLEAALAGVLAEYGPNKGALDDILAEANRRSD